MVQRKLPTKLTLHSQTFSLSHDIKSPRGADLKAKKMKKSGSTKRPKQPPPLLNYMKSTTSSDARKEQSQSKPKLGSSSAKKAVARMLTKNPTFKPARTVAARNCGSVVMCENLDARRGTCSSTLKDCKFPAYLSHSPGGTESVVASPIKVCPYTYCSLSGHRHAPLPPLKCFLSARRRAIKTQRSMKLGCLSPRRVQALKDDGLKNTSVSPAMEEQRKDFFVEVYTSEGAGVDEIVMDDQDLQVCSDFDANCGQIEDVLFEEQDSDGFDMDYCTPLQLDYDYECLLQTAIQQPDPEADGGDNKIIQNEFAVSSDGEDCYYDENLADDASQESLNEDGFSSDAFSSCNDGEHNETSVLLQAEGACDEGNGAMPECKITRTDPQTTSWDDEASSDIVHHECFPNVVAEAEGCIETETGDIILLQFTSKKKKLVQDGDEHGAFNPRAPNFLALETDPEAEKVDLKHQDLDERKNAEEWMVDYALRQVLTKVGPTRKRKVSLLVEAFEKVMPATKWDLQTRPVQFCI